MQKTVPLIYEHYRQSNESGRLSRTVPCSMLGEECMRKLWYLFHQACKPNFDGRMYRLFETGQLEEARLVQDLRAIGVQVSMGDKDGKQWEVTALGGHLKGKLDGAALGIPEAPKAWHVLEFKTHNDKSYKKLVKEGVKGSNWKHWVQCQIYMHLTGMHRALYLAKNKNTDELYAERIAYDKDCAERHIRRAQDIISSDGPPERPVDRSDNFLCRFCDARDICWPEGRSVALPIPALTCRVCVHANPHEKGEGGQWHCKKHGTTSPPGQELVPCAAHLTHPGLLPFAEPKDYVSGPPEKIVFHNERDHITWEHGPQTAHSSENLMRLPVSALGNKTLEKVHENFGGKLREESKILQDYEGKPFIIHECSPQHLTTLWRELYDEDVQSLNPLRTERGETPVAEYYGGRVIISHLAIGHAEIRDYGA